jgi:hypothetical protein
MLTVLKVQIENSNLSYEFYKTPFTQCESLPTLKMYVNVPETGIEKKFLSKPVLSDILAVLKVQNRKKKK